MNMVNLRVLFPVRVSAKVVAPLRLLLPPQWRFTESKQFAILR